MFCFFQLYEKEMKSYMNLTVSLFFVDFFSSSLGRLKLNPIHQKAGDFLVSSHTLFIPNIALVSSVVNTQS